MPYSYSAKAASGQPRPEREPSTWPVYLMCVLMGLWGLSAVGWIWFLPWMAHVPTEAFQHPRAQAFHALVVRLAPYAPLFGIWGAFALVAAVGAWLLRPWGWWCAALWIATQLLWTVELYLHVVLSTSQPISLPGLAPSAALFAFYVWVLVSRRQLFFRGT